jgi:SAM-dependent methyltransferase
MVIPKTYSFTRYLAAKKTVDDRSFNRRVLGSLTRELSNNMAKLPIEVLEVGAGIGTMVERLLAWKVLGNAAYTAIDGDPDVIAEACRRLPRWASGCGYRLSVQSPEKMVLKKTDQDISVEFEAIEFGDFVKRERGRRSWDLLLANAFLDLIEVPSALPRLFSLLRPGGLIYFTINFDGVTILQPEIDPALDRQIVTLYHRAMDNRVTPGEHSGESCTGRHLFANLRACGAELLDVGSSDWVLFAGFNGYPEDEAYFLHHIIQTIHTALNGSPELDANLFASWIRERHNQVEQGRLIYIAHQLDFFGRVPGQRQNSPVKYTAQRRSPRAVKGNSV